MFFEFGFSGGASKYPSDRVASKFLLFHLIPDINTGKIDEKIFFQALRDGSILDCTDQKSKTKNYTTNFPLFKLFSLAEGFGVRKSYFSLYFSIDPNEKLIRFTPICSLDKEHFFLGRVKFLTSEEVTAISDITSISYSFYKKQQPLSRSVLNRIISIEDSKINPASSQIRCLRI